MLVPFTVYYRYHPNQTLKFPEIPAIRSYAVAERGKSAMLEDMKQLPTLQSPVSLLASNAPFSQAANGTLSLLGETIVFTPANQPSGAVQINVTDIQKANFRQVFSGGVRFSLLLQSGERYVFSFSGPFRPSRFFSLFLYGAFSGQPSFEAALPAYVDWLQALRAILPKDAITQPDIHFGRNIAIGVAIGVAIIALLIVGFIWFIGSPYA